MDTILVIDDDAGMRDLLTELLRNPDRSILKTRFGDSGTGNPAE